MVSFTLHINSKNINLDGIGKEVKYFYQISLSILFYAILNIIKIR